MARLLRYDVSYPNGGNALDARFGFVGAGKSRLSKSYKDILIAQQQGDDVPVAEQWRRDFGKRMARIGAKMIKDGNADKAKYFFLKKSTGRGKIELPQRDIIRTFWKRHRSEALKNVRENYRRKMAGERI